MKFDISKPPTTDDSGPTYEPLASGVYHVKCVGAKIAPSKFADEKTGEYREELTLIWDLMQKVSHPESPSKEYSDRLYQHMSPYAGLTNAGTPSKFLAFMQQLAGEGLINPADVYIADGEVADNQGDLLGIQRRLLVQKYQKRMGANAGQWGNKVVDILPLDGPVPVAEAVGAVPSRPIPAHTNDPSPYTEADIAAMNADELQGIAKAMSKDAGGRFLRRPYDTMNHAALVKQVLEMQNELDPTADLF